jgi:hypothetical protein
MDRLARSGTVIDAFLLKLAKDEFCGDGDSIFCLTLTMTSKVDLQNQLSQDQFTAFEPSKLQGFH